MNRFSKDIDTTDNAHLVRTPLAQSVVNAD
jgi:hypothetical protein